MKRLKDLSREELEEAYRCAATTSEMQHATIVELAAENLELKRTIEELCAQLANCISGNTLH